MMTFRWIKIRPEERGLLFADGSFTRLLRPGWHFLAGLGLRVERLSVRDAWFAHADLEVIARSPEMGAELEVLDLKDHERALVWINGRLDAVKGAGLAALWTAFHQVRVERVDARVARFEHAELPLVLKVKGSVLLLQAVTVPPGARGQLFLDGRHQGELEPGVHAFWRGEGEVQVKNVDLRQQSLDVAGQEILTADRVTLRLNTVVVYRVVDAVKAATVVESFEQALYRQAQLALRAVVGTRELDALLAEKDGVARELAALVGERAAELGLAVESLGIRDVILPGEMKEILNRVTEARKAAEAAVFTRREETAAMRSQANTARIFESNPTLMRLKELEVLEKVAAKANLSVVLGEGGLSDRVVKLI